MRLFRNLSVGRKLAASATLAILMLGALVGVVHWSLDRAGRNTAEAETMVLAQRELAAVGRLVAQATIRDREVMAAQAPAPLALAMTMARRMAAEAATRLQALDGTVPAALGPDLAAVRQAMRDSDLAIGEIAAHRIGALLKRDQRLFPLMGEYDQAFEAVGVSLDHDLPAEARDAARERLVALHVAVNELRLNAQRFLITGDEAQARRARGAAAQQRVHLRGLLGITGERLAHEMQRLQQSAEGMAQSAVEVIAAEELASRIARERTGPARQRAEQALESANRGLDPLAAELLAAARAAKDTAVASVVWTGGAVVVVLMLSGWASANAIAPPLRRLAATVRAIAAGEATTTVGDRDRRDEIGLIAEALEGLRGTVARAFAQQQMLEQMPTAVMTADPRDGFRIKFMNPASRDLLRGIEHLLPCKVEAMEGQGIDILYKGLASEPGLLADAAALPHKARIRLGEEVLDLSVNAIRDAEGAYVSAMFSWSVATA